MLELKKRHTPKCPHRDKGSGYFNCRCPIRAEGTIDGWRVRKSLGRDLARASRKLDRLIVEITAGPQPERIKPKLLAEAVEAFHRNNDGLSVPTKRKHKRILKYLSEFCQVRNIGELPAITVDLLDDYKAQRKIALSTWSKELEILRQFFRFCGKRKWTEENPAEEIDMPTNLKPNEIVPYTADEVVRMLRATREFGRHDYERLRARAMILLFRYTALSIGDVATLERNRISNGEIFVRRTKSGGIVKLPLHPEAEAAIAVLPTPRGAPRDCPYFFWTGLGSREGVAKMAGRTLQRVFERAMVPNAHAHRFRHTLATELLAKGATFEDIADILGNSPAIVRKHYAKWSSQRQERISNLMQTVVIGTDLAQTKSKQSMC